MGTNLFTILLINKIVIERNPEPCKTIFTDEYDSYCLLEEIGSTNQWVPCKIHGKQREQYIVELKNRTGYKILKNREDLLLSKIQMQIYEKNFFDY